MDIRHFKPMLIFFQTAGMLFVGLSLLLFDSGFVKPLGFAGYNVLLFSLVTFGLVFLYINTMPRLTFSVSRLNACIVFFSLSWMLYLTFLGIFGEKWSDGGLGLFVLAVQVIIVAVFVISVHTKSLYFPVRWHKFILCIFAITSCLMFVMFKLDFFYLNENWVGLAVFFCLFSYFSVRSKRINYLEALLWLGIGLLVFFVFDARGVGLAIFVFAFCLFVFQLFSFRRTLLTLAFSLVLLASLLGSISFATLYGSDIHKEMNAISREWTGASLSSGRLVRWSLAYELSSANWEKIIYGYGVDGVSYYIVPSLDKAHGAVHNMWLDCIVRVGWIGVVLKYILLMLIFVKFTSLIHKRFFVYYVSFMFCLPILMVVYSLFGFTHVPATIVLAVILGIGISGDQRYCIRNNLTS